MNSCCVFYSHYIILLSTVCFVNAVNEDPTRQELDMFDWTSGIRVAYCVDSPLPDMLSPFRRTLSKVVSKYCLNTTACNLKKHVVFGPEQIVMLDGFPRRDFGAIQLKFYVVLPHSTDAAVKQQRPLLPRAVLSDILNRHIMEISNRLGWSIISYEKFPRYDSITEFMNIAIIPIVILSVPLMIFLAYWTSTLRTSMSSEAWMVTGAAGGKNAALRRTMEIIAEQNEEIERQMRYEKSKNVSVTGGNEGIAATGQLLLNVARLSMHSSATSTAPQHPPMPQGPSIVPFRSLVRQREVYPSVDSDDTVATTAASGSITGVTLHPHAPVQATSHHLTVRPVSPRRHSRRQSSLEDAKMARRRAQSIHRGSTSAPKQWKSGSLMLGGLRR